MGGPIFLPQCLRAVVLKGDGNKVLPPLQISSAFCVNGKSGLGRVAGALRHSTVTIAPLCSWGLQRNQAEEFGHSGLLQQWHRGGGWGLPSYVCGSWDLLVEVLQAPELAWSATGSCELDKVEFHDWIVLIPLTAHSEFSQCEAQYPSPAQRQGCSRRSMWTAWECHGAGEGGSTVKCDRAVMNTRGGGYEPGAAFLLRSVGLILTALTGQDSHLERGWNEGYVTLNLISSKRI